MWRRTTSYALVTLVTAITCATTVRCLTPGATKATSEVSLSEAWCEPPSGELSRIGGSEASLTDFGFVVSLTVLTEASQTRLCSGTLLTPKFVITAAACVFDASQVTCHAGSTNPSTAPYVVLATVHVHPNFYTSKNDHNVALVELQDELPLAAGSVSTINLAYRFNTDEPKDLVQKNVIVLGMGPATRLRYARMRVMTQARCVQELRRRYAKPGNHQLCLNTEGGTLGLCTHQDIGGPVIYKFDTDITYSLAGITTYYYNCRSATPNIFTRLGPSWDWIRKHVRISDNIG